MGCGGWVGSGASTQRCPCAGVHAHTQDQGSEDNSVYPTKPGELLQPRWQVCRALWQPTPIMFPCANAIRSRDSSVGRASDQRSEGPQFDPGSRHCMTGVILLCIGWQVSCLILVMLHMNAGTLHIMACAAIHRHMVEAHSAMRTLVVCRLKVANGRRRTTYSHRTPRSKVWRTMVGAKQAVNT